MRINKLIAGIALGLLVIGAGQAKASTMFGFSYSGTLGANSVSGSGTLFGTDLGSGTFLLTSGSGTSSEAGNLTLMTAGTYIEYTCPKRQSDVRQSSYSAKQPDPKRLWYCLLRLVTPVQQPVLQYLGQRPE